MCDRQIQNIMFEVFTYASIADGIMEAKDERREDQRKQMREQDLKIRSMLISLSKEEDHG